jgi:hypothetical protein
MPLQMKHISQEDQQLVHSGTLWQSMNWMIATKTRLDFLFHIYKKVNCSYFVKKLLKTIIYDKSNNPVIDYRASSPAWLHCTCLGWK